MLSTVIKSIQDIMRKDAGVDGDAQRISQITWMIFLKVFDDKEKEWELENHYKSPIPEKFRWRNWAADPEGITGDELLDFIGEMFKTLKELPADNDLKTDLVRELFSDSYNYMKSGTLIRQVVNKLNEIDFNKSEDRHLFNDIYEKILKDLQSAGNAGEYYTPRAVTQFIVDMSGPKLGQKILDPACGTGGFLVCALENLKKQVKTVDERKQLQEDLMGIEKKPLPHLLCTTNMILHDIEVPNIRHDNSLARPIVDYGPADMVDIVVTNPPFGGAEETGIELNFPSAFRTRETADLFLVLIMKLLRSEGKCGIVLPDSFLAWGGVKTRIKEKLLSEFNLHTIIRMPRGVFAPYSDIETNLLFFDKGKPTKEIWYFEHPLPKNYKKYTKTKPILEKEFDLEKEWWNDRDNPKFENFAWKAGIDDIKKQEFNLIFNNPKKCNKSKIYSANELSELTTSYAKNIDQKLLDITKALSKINFEKMKLGDVLKQYRVTHWVNDNNIYRQLTISKDGSVSFRAEKVGNKIGRKRQFVVDLKKHPNTLIFTRQGVAEGAIGIIPKELDGCLVTENMPMFEVIRINPDYLKWYITCFLFKNEVKKLIPMGTAQKAIHERDLLKINILVPSDKEQERIVKILEKLEGVKTDINKLLDSAGQYKDTIFYETFGTENLN